MSTTRNPEVSVRPAFPEAVEREPGTGRLIQIRPDGTRRVIGQDESGAVVKWPSEDTPQRRGKK